MVAFELKNGCFADEEEIREFCVEFPMTASGKVQEFGLREIAVRELDLEDVATTGTA
jgi:acyl-coenzyme A synthetase/AMP-(fatty) acid ligase